MTNGERRTNVLARAHSLPHRIIVEGPWIASLRLNWTEANWIERSLRELVQLVSVVTGQLADPPTRGLPTRGLDISRTGQLAV